MNGRPRRAFRLAIAIALFALGYAWPVAAEVTAVAANGFTVRASAHIGAPAHSVYQALLQPARWWSAAHTFSHNAANLTLEARAGGCFCEQLANGGSVQHLIVVMVQPDKLLTLRGALGPFQSQGVDGALNWSVTGTGPQSELTLTYTLGGFVSLPGGFEEWAPKVDAMLSEQLHRLQNLLQTGTPEAHR
ncbi:MAG TPA: SRPBCC family protein [Steroidobacteraceae bacterium]|nr:SRPBCC family protein [Steroidobacteraceae bacterium]